MDIRDIYIGLNQSGYICDPLFAAKITAALDTRPQAGAFLFGRPGNGKTDLPERLAGLMDARLAFQQCFTGTREQDLMVRMVPDEDTRSGIRASDGVMPEAVGLLRSEPGPVIMVLDEWDKTRPSADAFLLDFLQNGRLRYAGKTLVLTAEERSRLSVFVTMNDERDISDVLLRRLPKIDFDLLPPETVRKALQKSHGAHPLLEPCITLYRRCMMANLPKPCTIQELRQLIDAASLLGPYADWDTLVYMYVTKTPEAHSMLIAAEQKPLADEPAKRPELSVQAYGMAELPAMPRIRNPRMPGLAEARGWGRATAPESDADTSKLGGIVAATDTAYDAILDLAGPPGPDPANIGGAGSVNGDVILVNRGIPLSAHASMEKLWGQNGEVAFTAAKATMADVMGLRSCGWKVVSYSADRLVAKTDGMELSWTAADGIEMVVGLDARPAFDLFLRENCPVPWLEEPAATAGVAARRRRIRDAA